MTPNIWLKLQGKTVFAPLSNAAWTPATRTLGIPTTTTRYPGTRIKIGSHIYIYVCVCVFVCIHTRERVHTFVTHTHNVHAYSCVRIDTYEHTDQIYIYSTQFDK